MAKGTSGGTGGAKGGLQRPVQPSEDLSPITGSDPLPRSQVVSKMWDYIKKNNLQNPENKREIVADRGPGLQRVGRADPGGILRQQIYGWAR